MTSFPTYIELLFYFVYPLNPAFYYFFTMRMTYPTALILFIDFSFT